MNMIRPVHAAKVAYALDFRYAFTLQCDEEKM